MTSTWLSIRVDLVEGGGQDLWPRPGRVFAAARTHTFGQLAVAIDDAFARWDRAHLYQYYLAGGRQVSDPRWRDEDDDDGLLDGQKLTLGHLKAGEQFVYEFDFGDSWLHLCTVGARRIDPIDELGIIAPSPLPYWVGSDARPVRAGVGQRRRSDPGPARSRTRRPAPHRPVGTAAIDATAVACFPRQRWLDGYDPRSKGVARNKSEHLDG